MTIAVNFLLVAVDAWVEDGRSLMRQTREAFIPPLPGHLAAGVLAAILAVAYTNLGPACALRRGRGAWASSTT